MARKFKLSGGSLTSNKIFVLVGVLVLLGVGYYLLTTYNNTYYAPTEEAFTSAEVDSEWGKCEDPAPKAGEVVVAAFIAKWCPHCVNYHPTWNKIKAEAKKKNPSVNGKKVRFVTVNCSESCDVSEKYGVEGFPTVKVIHSASKHEDLPYEARDSLDDILAHLKN